MDANGVDDPRLRAKILGRMQEYLTRSEHLCTYSNDGRFCDNPKIDPPAPNDRDGTYCFCEDHQGQLRYGMTCFDEPNVAGNWARAMRSHGYNANIWQMNQVIVGPTADPTSSIKGVGGWVIGFFEAQMYEDVLMLAINHLKLDLSHIVGQEGNQNGY